MRVTAHPDLPDVVRRALRSSLELGYIHTTRTETGRLLATLAATRTGTIAECGTGCGVGAAWLRSGAPAGTRVLTAESDAELAASAQATFAEDEIEVQHTDWKHLSCEAPFSLLFLDSTVARECEVDDVVELVGDGGIIVIDDLTPTSAFPPADHSGSEALRMGWLTDPRLTGVDLMVASDSSVLVAVRRPDEAAA